MKIYFSLNVLILCFWKSHGATENCKDGRKNGVLDIACLMQQVEDKSDSGKSIFKSGDSQYSINVTFTLLSIDGLTDDGTFQARIRLRTQWFDPNLAWNSSELSNGEDIIVMPASLARWPQFITLYDQDLARSMVEKMSDFPVTVRSSGLNEHVVEVTTLTSCTLDTTYFPQDIQACAIMLAPLPLGVSDIATLNVAYADDDDLFDASNDWPLEKDTSYPTGINVDQSGNSYVYMEVQAKRNPHSIDISLVTPMYVFSFVSAIIYLLPPASGERIGSSITMILTIAVTMLVVKDLLPSSDPTKDDPYFSVFTDIVFAQTMILFVESILVLAVWESERPIHWCLKKQQIDQEDEDKQAKMEISYKKTVLRIDFFFFIANLIVSIVSVIYTNLRIYRY